MLDTELTAQTVLTLVYQNKNKNSNHYTRTEQKLIMLLVNKYMQLLVECDQKKNYRWWTMTSAQETTWECNVLQWCTRRYHNMHIKLNSWTEHITLILNTSLWYWTHHSDTHFLLQTYHELSEQQRQACLQLSLQLQLQVQLQAQQQVCIRHIQQQSNQQVCQQVILSH